MVVSMGGLIARWQSRQLFARFAVEKEGKLARTYLDDLLDQSLLPVMEQVVRRRLRNLPATQEGGDDLAERVRGRALAYLIPPLYGFRESRAIPPDLIDLATCVTKRALGEAIEESHTAPRRLRHRVLALLSADSNRFTVETDPLWGWRVGVAGASTKLTSGRWQELLRNPEGVAARVLPEGESAPLADRLAELLGWVGHLVVFEELLEVVWALVGDTSEAAAETGTAPSTMAEATEAHFLLSQLWRAVCSLPVRQRIIVLLGLTDARGGSLLECLSQLGVASEEELSQALEIGAKSYALLRRELPCNDTRIAELLKSTPEAVASLRHVARARLMTSLVLWGQQ